MLDLDRQYLGNNGSSLDYMEAMKAAIQQNYAVVHRLTSEKVLGLVNEIPVCEVLIESQSALREVASRLYGISESSITDLEVTDFRYRGTMRKIKIQIGDNHTEHFYVKRSWETALKEGLGMGLTNVLLKKTFNFMVDLDTQSIAMDEVPGRTFNDLGDYKFSEKASWNYGGALEFANALKLGDRNSYNLILTPDEDVVNIDFGFIFLGDYSDRDEIGTKPCGVEEVQLGQDDARMLIRKNMESNRLLLDAVFEFVHSKTSFNFHPMESMNTYLSR